MVVGDARLVLTLPGHDLMAGAYMLDKELLDILACPQCKGRVEYNASKSGLVCRACKLEYPIRDDIPIMLIDEAKPTKD